MKKEESIFTAGQPGKKNKSEALDEKAFRLGFLAAAIQADRQNLQMEKAQAEQELATAMEQILQAQAQQAMQAQQGAIAGFQAGANAGASASFPEPSMMGGEGTPPQPSGPDAGGGAIPPTAEEMGFA